MQTTHNAICYVEFHASDLTKTKAFFEKVFGSDYVAFEDGHLAGGFARSDKKASLATGSALVVIFSTELEKTLAQVVTHGGTITQDIFSYPGGRRFHFTEPSGNELSVCTES